MLSRYKRRPAFQSLAVFVILVAGSTAVLAGGQFAPSPSEAPASNNADSKTDSMFEYESHVMTRTEIESFKAVMGVRDPQRNYNILFDGLDRGLCLLGRGLLVRNVDSYESGGRSAGSEGQDGWWTQVIPTRNGDDNAGRRLELCPDHRYGLAKALSNPRFPTVDPRAYRPVRSLQNGSPSTTQEMNSRFGGTTPQAWIRKGPERSHPDPRIRQTSRCSGSQSSARVSYRPLPRSF